LPLTGALATGSGSIAVPCLEDQATGGASASPTLAVPAVALTTRPVDADQTS